MAIDLSRRSMPKKYTAIIESKIQLTQNIYLVNFRLQNPSTISFLAGQTFSLHVGDNLNRSMSIASPPSETSRILMVHDVSPMGLGSKWTIAHNVGDVATFMAPLGIFLMDNSPRKKVFIATGTGVAPFRSMLLDGISQPVTLYWGLRHEEDIYWKEEFEHLADTRKHFSFKLTLSRPHQHWSGMKGRVTDHVLDEEKHLTDSEFYLCGNRAMVKEMEEQLLAVGVPKAQVYKEMFY